jgi:hypothetical protein
MFMKKRCIDGRGYSTSVNRKGKKGNVVYLKLLLRDSLSELVYDAFSSYTTWRRMLRRQMNSKGFGRKLSWLNRDIVPAFSWRGRGKS